jgi:uncharacterized protein (TIGR02246 family)
MQSMRNACLLLTICVVGTLLSGQAPPRAKKALPAPASAAVAKPADVDKTIREAAQRYVDAFNAGDAKAVAALWAEDGDYVDEAGERTRGRAAIQAKYTEFLAANAGAKLNVTLDAVQQIAADTAIEDGHSTLTLPGQKQPASSGRYTVVHVKRDGKWQIASVRDLPGEPAAAGEPLADLDWMIGTWHAEHLGAEMEITCRWLADKSFVELTYARREGDKLTPTATQIFGRDPRSGQMATWMFSADKGYAQGVLVPHDTGWAMEFEGATADGTPTAAVNLLSRVNDALVWKSTQRMIGGEALPDTNEVVLKRK